MKLFPQQTAELRRHRMINWQTVTIDKVAAQLKQVANQAEQDGHPEKLYVSQDKPHRSIQLAFGQHPVGTTPGGTGPALEHGAALVLSQGANGEVAILLYPYKSELSRREEELIVWGVYDNPVDITERVLKRAISDFVCYGRVSSALDGGTTADQRRIAKLLKRDQFKSKAGIDAAKQAEAKSLEKKNAQSWGARFSTWTPFVAIGAVGILVTIVGGWHPFLDQLHEWFDDAIPALKKAPDETMPVISGSYTLCPEDNPDQNPNFADLLYDIGQHKGKVVFLDVNVGIACAMGAKQDWSVPFGRDADERSLTYHFNPGASRATLDGDRERAQLARLLPDNGTLLRILDDNGGRNAITALGINVEGVDDTLYGPYLIKARGEDASLTLELSAPVLDTPMQARAATIDRQRHLLHESEPPPKNLPKAIPVTAEQLRQLHEHPTSAGEQVFPKMLPPIPQPLSPVSRETNPPLPPLPIPQMISTRGREKDTR